ncbi:hypothetical protein NEOLEDRAFT_1131230 [Neolentinus lepideus HHB14362 ss-1]|uniref:BTB domain-containing protein n=1 Tax=Neolentinus lepideus HHB14362 ss-1 TaxID=1314782 RepID=A0A165TUK8_9AGAM|nr:hypothetical protein NEOLEDRAFT_1131230 [Neolentinus lepideus HHB14362 ss-1]
MQREPVEELIQRLVPTLLRELSITAASAPSSNASTGYMPVPPSDLTRSPQLSAPLSRSPSIVSSISLSPATGHHHNGPPEHTYSARAAPEYESPQIYQHTYSPVYHVESSVSPGFRPLSPPRPISVISGVGSSQNTSQYQRSLRSLSPVLQPSEYEDGIATPAATSDTMPLTRSPSPLRLVVALSTGAKVHDHYFFDDGTVTFMVERTLFRVHRFFFERDSALFRDQLLTHPEVRSGDSIVELKDCTALDFERFLGVLYPNAFNQHTATTLEEWSSILALSAQWGFESIRLLAIREVFPLASSIDRVALGLKYDIKDWLLDAYLDICLRRDPISDDEAERLGAKDVARVSRLREKILREQLPTSDLVGMTNLVENVFHLRMQVANQESSIERSRPDGYTTGMAAKSENLPTDESKQTDVESSRGGGSGSSGPPTVSQSDTDPNLLTRESSDSATVHPSKSISEARPTARSEMRASVAAVTLSKIRERAMMLREEQMERKRHMAEDGSGRRAH